MKYKVLTAAYIRVVFGSSFDPNTGYPDRDFCGFAQSLETKSEIVFRLNHYIFLPNPFLFVIHQSS
jgi:hypothetical protein